MSDGAYVGTVEQLVERQGERSAQLWPTFLTAEWRHLAMLSYTIDPAILKPHVPAGTELQLFHGQAIVSVVGFRFLNTRLFGMRVPLHGNFPEVNLRFYVRRMAGGEMRRGVAFLKEIVARRAVVCIARTVFHENYVRLPMRARFEYLADTSPPVCCAAEYDWRQRRDWSRVRVASRQPYAKPQPGTLAHFIVEQYWGYSAQPDGSCLEYRVQHPPWNMAPADEARFECDVASLYGPEFVEPLRAVPCSAMLVDGSGVTMSRGRRLTRPKR